MQKLGVMFVCLGNICRSPLAEAIFAENVKQLGLENQFKIESCGTANYHVGENPDPRTIAVAKKNDVPLRHKAQQLNSQHFTDFDYLIVMDESNMKDALKVAPQSAKYKLMFMRDFDEQGKGENVIDPWFGDDSGFDMCFEVLKRSCDAFLHNLVEKHNLSQS